MADILQAARSYYGMDNTPVGKCEMYTNEHGSMRLVIEIPVTGSDFIAIGQRMKAMQEAESQSDTVPLDIEMPDMADMRKAYEALSKAEKGRYGSFARYMAESSGGIVDIGQKARADYYDSMVSDTAATLLAASPSHCVDRVDAPEEPEPVSMDAVWLIGEEATTAQRIHSVDYNEDVGWLVQWAMLTDEQKQKAKERS